MAGTIFTSTIANALKETLDEIVDDDLDNFKEKAVFTKWMDIKSMSDNYEDDLETGGPGFAVEKTEGEEMALGGISEGTLTRYIARTFALKLIITEEAIEDRKYPKVLEAAKRLNRTMWKTADLDSTNVLARMFNPLYTLGDGQPLCSTAHTLPQGGTFSNVMTVPMSPSRVAMSILTSQMRKLPGHDGTIEGYEPRKVLCPMEQWYIWKGLVMSEKAPEPGAFNEINVVRDLFNDDDVIPIKYWTNTSTNWAILTDADQRPNFRWRRKPRSRTWVDNDQELMKYGISARWARGASDARGIMGVQA